MLFRKYGAQYVYKFLNYSMKRVVLNLLIVLNISFAFDSDWINNELSKYGCNDYQFEEDYQFIKDIVRNYQLYFSE